MVTLNWKPDKGRAICPQICEQICRRIVRGDLPAGERLPSVREYAVQIGVNPNTVQHAFDELQKEGVLYAVQNVGWFACEDLTTAQTTVQRLAREKTEAFFTEMSNLGWDAEAVKQFVKEWNA